MKLYALCSGDEGGTLQPSVPFKSLVTVQAAPEVGDPHLHYICQQSLERLYVCTVLSQRPMLCAEQVDTTGMTLVDAQALTSGQAHHIPGTTAGSAGCIRSCDCISSVRYLPINYESGPWRFMML